MSKMRKKKNSSKEVSTKKIQHQFVCGAERFYPFFLF